MSTEGNASVNKAWNVSIRQTAPIRVANRSPIPQVNNPYVPVYNTAIPVEMYTLAQGEQTNLIHTAFLHALEQATARSLAQLAPILERGTKTPAVAQNLQPLKTVLHTLQQVVEKQKEEIPKELLKPLTEELPKITGQLEKLIKLLPERQTQTTETPSKSPTKETPIQNREIENLVEELSKSTPAFIRLLERHLPLLAPKLLTQVTQTLEEPSIKEFLQAPKELVFKEEQPQPEPFVRHKSLAPFAPTAPPLKEQPPIREEVPFQFVRPEVVLRKYPNFIHPRTQLSPEVVKVVTQNYQPLPSPKVLPKVEQKVEQKPPLPVQTAPTSAPQIKQGEIPPQPLVPQPQQQAPPTAKEPVPPHPLPMQVVPLPPVPFLEGLVNIIVPIPFFNPREKEVMNKIEKFVFDPFYNTEIPFAFIVPYISANPIHTNPPSVNTGKARFVEEGEYEEEALDEPPMLLLSYVPAGGSLYGDPFGEGEKDEQPLRSLYLDKFGIGTFLVTNEQFADFLDKQSKLSLIKIDEKGFVKDLHGKILCQVKASNHESDIETISRKYYLGFNPAKEKGAYPVTSVTYFGAKAFCENGGFRLPTEAEWEKAASVQIDSEGNPVYKYRYGCHFDVIDASLANYQDSSFEDGSFLGHSTQVGFYNGQKVQTKDGKVFQTHQATSPFGCYDMSGNVAEWTNTGTGGRKVIKGGSFQSLSKGIRASAREWMDEDELNNTTGFRVVLSS